MDASTSATGASPSAPPPEPKYKAVLDKAQRKQGGRAAATYRVVIVGPMGAGKRTAAAQLREALAFGDRVRSSGKKTQCGVDYAYVDVRQNDGTMRHTVEFVIIDSPALLDVVIQPEHLSRCVVVFACNVAAPREAVVGINEWARRVNQHVAALVGAERAAAMSRTRSGVCDRGLEAVADLLPPTLTRIDESEGVTDFDLRTVESVCVLPCAVVVTKLDLIDTLPATKVSLTAAASVGSDRFLRDAIRATCVKLGAAVVMSPQGGASGGGGGGSAATGGSTDEFQLAVASHLVAMAAEPDAPANTDALAGAFGCELHMSLFLPAGADTGRTIPKAIAAESIAVEEVFPAPVNAAAHDHHAASPASAGSPMDAHQAELRQLALTVAATPLGGSGATRSKASVSVAPTDRGLSQPPAHATSPAPATNGAAPGAAAAKEDSGDDVDLEFDDLE